MEVGLFKHATVEIQMGSEKDYLPVGLMALVKEDFLPDCKWVLGCISGIYTGLDGKVRVVKVCTKLGELKQLQK